MPDGIQFTLRESRAWGSRKAPEGHGSRSHREPSHRPSCYLTLQYRCPQGHCEVRTPGSQTFRDLSQSPQLAGGREVTQVVGLGSARFRLASQPLPALPPKRLRSSWSRRLRGKKERWNETTFPLQRKDVKVSNLHVWSESRVPVGSRGNRSGLGERNSLFCSFSLLGQLVTCNISAGSIVIL